MDLELDFKFPLSHEACSMSVGQLVPLSLRFTYLVLIYLFVVRQKGREDNREGTVYTTQISLEKEA